ncbi:exocyst complex component Sec10 [Cordyceps fumosorosea ARSEF 2679]|uniref:Exocyst complex component Sec10 n=1 Tax=Cordyceps fumosorosea (strain ARSEF 2679) TaxID=1081104 RepID=A0A167XHV7_CORFA|nr:exocyst complex component Sec10 [Cordyceps fumosorosea ARSEF 2679]OAA64993.1 exocyst complex component Sec10 [Cordyceps fumosorosea ARSEF 2679]
MDRTSIGAKSLFPKGPSFTLDNFSNKDFIVRDFVDSLAESAVPINRRSGPAQPAFDAKPLIRTFENALSQLAILGDELQEKESELLSQVRRAEIQHDQTLDTLGRKLDQSMSSFEALDGTAASGKSNNYEVQSKSDGEGNVAVQIGEKLEDLDRKRRRAQDAQFLIQCWSEVSDTGMLASLEDIRRQGGAENKIRCAVIARQLMRISQQLDQPSWGHANGQRRSSVGGGNGSGNGVKTHNTREVLERFCESLEQDLLQQFNNSYRKQNFDDMLECARVLHDFNGGASVIAAFVNQHQFFIDRDQLMNDEVIADTDIWEPIADPDATPPGVEASLQSLIDEVKIVMQEESFIIKRAFPYYETVLAKFIQRVFQQSIQQRLEKVLDKADTVSSLAFLRSLHSSRSYISSLIEDLKTHGLTEHPEPCSGQIAQTLDQQVDELFVPYLVGNLYIEREKKSIEEMYSSLLFKFTMYHSRKKKAPTGFMASLAQQGTQLMASAKDAYLERLESSDLTPTQKATMLRVAGIAEKDNKNEIELSEDDGTLSVANAKRMLKWLAESVQRTLELGAAVDTPKEMSVFMNLLLSNMGQVYVQTALDAAHMQATILENSKTEPDMAYLPAIRPAVTISAIMDRFNSTVLIRLAESNTTVRKSMEAQKKMAIDDIEKKTNAVIKISIDVIVNFVAKTLSGQKKQDFRPKDMELESLQTPTCLTICTFLGRAEKHASAAVDGANAEKFFSELATELHRLLFDHFKRFQVNATGGLMVTQDIAKYVSVVRGWPLARDIGLAVELLTEIGSLFIVGAEALREKARGLAPGQTAAMAAARGKLSKADFQAFVQRRDDASSVGIQSMLAGL